MIADVIGRDKTITVLPAARGVAVIVAVAALAAPGVFAPRIVIAIGEVAIAEFAATLGAFVAITAAWVWTIISAVAVSVAAAPSAAIAVAISARQLAIATVAIAPEPPRPGAIAFVARLVEPCAQVFYANVAGHVVDRFDVVVAAAKAAGNAAT
jgi:hypothetical protein